MTQPNGHQYAPIPAQRDQLEPAAAGDDVPWARQATSRQPKTSRSRQRVRDLPNWDPLPPGEIFVQRHGRD